MLYIVRRADLVTSSQKVLASTGKRLRCIGVWVEQDYGHGKGGNGLYAEGIAWQPALPGQGTQILVEGRDLSGRSNTNGCRKV